MRQTNLTKIDSIFVNLSLFNEHSSWNDKNNLEWTNLGPLLLVSNLKNQSNVLCQSQKLF